MTSIDDLFKVRRRSAGASKKAYMPLTASSSHPGFQANESWTLPETQVSPFLPVIILVLQLPIWLPNGRESIGLD